MQASKLVSFYEKLERMVEKKLNLKLINICCMCFELEGKLEFPSYLALVLVPHWIGDERLDNIYILTLPMPIVMSVGPWATSPHARTRAEPIRARPGAGGARPRPADTNAVRFRGLLDLLHFFYL